MNSNSKVLWGHIHSAKKVGRRFHKVVKPQRMRRKYSRQKKSWEQRHGCEWHVWEAASTKHERHSTSKTKEPLLSYKPNTINHPHSCTHLSLSASHRPSRKGHNYVFLTFIHAVLPVRKTLPLFLYANSLRSFLIAFWHYHFSILPGRAHYSFLCAPFFCISF